MAVAVAAAGSVAGGLAGNAIVGKTPAYTGGGIPGVTVTQQTSKGKKKDPMAGIPQVDSTQAIKFFQDAATAQEQGYNQGLQYYQTALTAASSQMQSAYDSANATLKPLSYASNQALNQQMRMLGMAPLSATYNMADEVKKLGAFEGSDQLKAQVTAAESLTDPVQRAAAKDQIMQQVQALQKPYDATKETQALGARPEDIAAPGTEQFNPGAAGGFAEGLLAYGKSVEDAKSYDARVAQRATEQAAWDAKNQTIQDSVAARDAQNAGLKDFGTQYNDLYTQNADTGFTGQQVSDIITATPGYAFQLDQGTKAVERQGASKGMLGSGNTLLGLQNYGQQLAQNSYQGYMSNLSNIVSQGSGATAQIAANQVSLGNAQAGLTQLAGKSAMDTQQAIADKQAQSLYQQGYLFNDNAKFNANLQFQQKTLNQKLAASSQANALNNATQSSIANGQLGLATDKFNYEVVQGQQTAAGFLGGSGSSAATY